MLALTLIANSQSLINGYYGDKPLTTIKHDNIKGGLNYTIGDSIYKTLASGEGVEVNFDINIPSNASIEYARMYAYWTWSTSGENASLTMKFNSKEVTIDKSYTDRKGFGTSDYPSGVYAYNVTLNESGRYTATVTNSGENTTSIQGIGLLVVYNDSKSSEIEYWINEGYDILFATAKYNTTPDNATTSSLFEGSIDKDNVTATLWTIAPSADKNANFSALYFNDKEWIGVWTYLGDSNLAVDQRDVTEFLLSENNQVKFQDRGDYMVASNAFLVLTSKKISLCGDLDNNGKIESKDALMALQMAVGILPLYPAADVNGDGEVTSVDALMILQKGVGMPVVLKCTGGL